MIHNVKKPLSAYLIFAREKRAQMSDVSACEQMRRIGEMWAEIDPQEKEEFHLKAKQDRDRYLSELSELPAKSKPILLKSCVNGSGLFKQLKTRIASPLNPQPRKKLSPYIFFIKEAHEKLKQQGNKLRFDQTMKQLADQWHNMTPEEKQKYSDMASADQTRYDNDVVKLREENEKRKKETPVIAKSDLDGMPKKPLSAYMLFAKDVRAVLKKKMP